MSANNRSDRKWRHYSCAVLLLAGMTVGGVITLNCTPEASFPRGQLEAGQEGVQRDSGGGIAFDVTSNVASARFTLPSEVAVGTQFYPVTWESPDPDEAMVEGDVIATVYKDETRRSRTIRFVGRYLVGDEVRIVRYPLNVSNF